MQKQRDLENRLDKAGLKCREAEHIQRTYLQIKMKLEDEHQSFGNILDTMELDLVRCDDKFERPNDIIFLAFGKCSINLS